MSQEELDLVVRGLSAVIRRPKPDFEVVNALFHPEHVFVPTTAQELGEGEAKGARGYQEYTEGVADSMPFAVEMKGAVDVAPGIVLVVTDMRFHGSASGIELDRRVWMLARVVGGKITRTEAYSDPADALEAVGLTE